MSQSLISFLSNFNFFENERNLFLEIENYLMSEFLIRPILVYSISNSAETLQVEKSRSILGKSDRLKLYSARLLDQMLNQREDIKIIPCLEAQIDECFYYYLNLGVKGSQFYFAVFSSPTKIKIEEMIALSHYSKSHLDVVKSFDELKKSQELIYIDDVTGLYNQRKLYKDLTILVEQFNSEKTPFSILFIDLDHFKQVNDNYGHLIGSKLLEAVARDMKSLLRDTDIMYRYGGDEFVVILAGAHSAAGKFVGERILKKIKSNDYKFEQKEKACSMKLSLSIGVAEFPSDAKSSDEVLALADRMMYEAKESGRGVVFNTHDVFKSALKKAIVKE